MSTTGLQFYPTPEPLARKAWGLFRQPMTITRLLEPSAGRGDLLLPGMVQSTHWRPVPMDVIEIDIRHHPMLKERGFNVIGTDFLQSQSLAQYSHIIMNPPFSAGARHVLHAYDHMLQGEIVAILNAETIRNTEPSWSRRMLAYIISECGEVEFVQGAFLDAERKTAVDVALVHLTKTATETDMVAGWLQDLKAADEARPAPEFDNQLALPRAEVENLVVAYNAAVEAATEAAVAVQKREYYKSLLGKTIYEQAADQGAPMQKVHEDIGAAVEDLRSRAWSAVLSRTAIADKLSTKARERLHAEFEDIKRMEFCLSNIGAFVSGILESQGDIQAEMLCDVFDLITKYHSGNRVYYRGWKSNDKHRTAGLKLKATRFILPMRTAYSTSLNYESMRVLDDIDKAFCLLDGRRWEDMDERMSKVAESSGRDLAAGDRLQAEYFEIRFYRGAGTMHFYPRRPDLVDRLNRVVGAQRQWLPPEGERVPKAFWVQYDKAEKFGDIKSRDVDAAAYEGRADYEEACRALDAQLQERHKKSGIGDPFGLIETQGRIAA